MDESSESSSDEEVESSNNHNNHHHKLNKRQDSSSETSTSSSGNSSSSDHLDKSETGGAEHTQSSDFSDDLIFEYSHDPNNPNNNNNDHKKITPKKAQQTDFNRSKSTEAPGRKLFSAPVINPSLLSSDSSSSSSGNGGFFRRPAADQPYDYSSFSNNSGADLPPIPNGKMSVPAVTDLSLVEKKLDETTATKKKNHQNTMMTFKTTTTNNNNNNNQTEKKQRLRKRTKSNGESLIVLYIQMRLCDFTLRYWMNNRNQEYFSEAHSEITFELDDALCMNIFRQIVAGVEYIHSKSIIHRDLKVCAFSLSLFLHISY